MSAGRDNEDVEVNKEETSVDKSAGRDNEGMEVDMDEKKRKSSVLNGVLPVLVNGPVNSPNDDIPSESDKIETNNETTNDSQSDKELEQPSKEVDGVTEMNELIATSNSCEQQDNAVKSIEDGTREFAVESKESTEVMKSDLHSDTNEKANESAEQPLDLDNHGASNSIGDDNPQTEIIMTECKQANGDAVDVENTKESSNACEESDAKQNGEPDNTQDQTVTNRKADSAETVEEKAFLPFPSITELNSRFRKLIAYFQRLKTTGEIERQKARSTIRMEPIDTELLSGCHKFEYDVKQLKWSRREAADFYRVVSGYGVDYNKEKNQYNWERFRTLANLTRKSDEALTEYFRAFYAMLRFVCKREPHEDGLPPSMIKVEPISEERASRCLSRIDLLNKIRNDALPHPQLDKHLEMCKRSSDFPDWWIPGKHDKDLLIGAAKHGLSRTDFYIMTDPDLCFKNIVTLIQQRVRSDPELTKQISVGASAAAISALTATIYAETMEQVVNQDKQSLDVSEDDKKKVLTEEDSSIKSDACPDAKSTASPLPSKSDSNQGANDQEEWSLKFATNIAISWPKDRIIQHRLEAVCQCIELGHWPSVRRFISLNAPVGSLSETPPIQSPSLLSSGGAPWSGNSGTFDLAGVQACSSSTSSRQNSSVQDQATVFSHIDQAMLHVLRGTGSLQPPAVPHNTSSRGSAAVGRSGRPRGRRKGINSGALHSDIPYRRFNSGRQSDDAESLTSLDNDTRTGTPLHETSARSISSSNPLDEIFAAAVAAKMTNVTSQSEKVPTSSAPLTTVATTDSIADVTAASNPRKRKIDSLADRLLNAAAAECGKKEKLESNPNSTTTTTESSSVNIKSDQQNDSDDSLWKVRVPVISLRDSSLVYGDEAPLRRDLEKWLTDHPDYMPYSVEKADQEIYGRVAKLRGQDTSAMEALAYSHYLSMLQASSSSFAANTPSSLQHGVSNSYLQQVANYSSLSNSKDKQKEERKHSTSGYHVSADENEPDVPPVSKSTISSSSRSRGRGRGRPPNSTIRDSLANQRSSKRPSHSVTNSSTSLTSSNSLGSSTVQQQQAALAAALVSAATGSTNQIDNSQLAAANLEAMMAAYQAYMYNPLMYTQLMAAQSAGYNNYLAAAAAAAVSQQQLFNGGAEDSAVDKSAVGESGATSNNSSSNTPLSRQIHSRGAKTASALAVAASGSSSKKTNQNSETSNKTDSFLKDYSSIFGLTNSDAASLNPVLSNSTSSVDMTKHSKTQNVSNLSSPSFDLNHKSDPAEPMSTNEAIDTDDCVLDLSKKT